MTLQNAVALGHNYLYHYQTFNPDHLREMLVEGVVHFSRPSDFNDPWDCRPWFDDECVSDPAVVEHHAQWYIDVTRRHRPDISIEEAKRRADVYRGNPEVLAEKIREFSDVLATAIERQYRIYCLTPKPDSELMWAHYASKHSGVCLEFGTKNELFCSALPVQYAKEYPRFSMTDFAGPEEHIAPLLTKSSAWGYEQEFRLISDENGDPRNSIVTANGKRAMPPMALTGVILGCLAPPSVKESIRQMIAASAHKPRLMAAVRSRSRYDLSIVPA